MSTFLFRASWPLDDEHLDRTQAELAAIAWRYVPDLLLENDAALVDGATPRWRIADAETVDRPASDGLVLIMEAPARPWVDRTHIRRGRHHREVVA